MSCEIIRRSETSCFYSLGEVSTDNYLMHSEPWAQCDYRSVSQGRSLTDVLGKSEAGKMEPVPWVAAEAPAHRLRVLQSDVGEALLPAFSRQVLSSRGLIRDAGVQAVRQNHFGSNYCNQVWTCGRGSGDTCYIPLITAQTAVSGQTERG